jgi:hypothetical protein
MTILTRAMSIPILLVAAWVVVGRSPGFTARMSMAAAVVIVEVTIAVAFRFAPPGAGMALVLLVLPVTLGVLAALRPDMRRPLLGTAALLVVTVVVCGGAGVSNGIVAEVLLRQPWPPEQRGSTMQLFSNAIALSSLILWLVAVVASQVALLRWYAWRDAELATDEHR